MGYPSCDNFDSVMVRVPTGRVEVGEIHDSFHVLSSYFSSHILMNFNYLMMNFICFDMILFMYFFAHIMFLFHEEPGESQVRFPCGTQPVMILLNDSHSLIPVTFTSKESKNESILVLH